MKTKISVSKSLDFRKKTLIFEQSLSTLFNIEIKGIIVFFWINFKRYKKNKYKNLPDHLSSRLDLKTFQYNVLNMTLILVAIIDIL